MNPLFLDALRFLASISNSEKIDEKIRLKAQSTLEKGVEVLDFDISRIRKESSPFN